MDVLGLAFSHSLWPNGAMNETTRPTGTTIPDPRITPHLSIPEAAALYGIGHKQTYTALRRGEIPGKRIGGRWVIPTAKVLADLGLAW